MRARQLAHVVRLAMDAGERPKRVKPGSKLDEGMKREARFHVAAGHTRAQVVGYKHAEPHYKTAILGHFDRMTRSPMAGDDDPSTPSSVPVATGSGGSTSVSTGSSGGSFSGSTSLMRPSSNIEDRRGTGSMSDVFE